mmetsp:Transcript_9616/g.28245  ORF Transcript_9616/g.28245 Transcript_9616/m.28245 type:complete len:272 (-) Transcript_9616:455-1270(-)
MLRPQSTTLRQRAPPAALLPAAASPALASVAPPPWRLAGLNWPWRVRNSTTTCTSSDSRTPRLTYSPWLCPQPAKSKAQTQAPRLATVLKMLLLMASTRDDALPCRNTTTGRPSSFSSSVSRSWMRLRCASPSSVSCRGVSDRESDELNPFRKSGLSPLGLPRPTVPSPGSAPLQRSAPSGGDLGVGSTISSPSSMGLMLFASALELRGFLLPRRRDDMKLDKNEPTLPPPPAQSAPSAAAACVVLSMGVQSEQRMSSPRLLSSEKSSRRM